MRNRRTKDPVKSALYRARKNEKLAAGAMERARLWPAGHERRAVCVIFARSFARSARMYRATAAYEKRRLEWERKHAGRYT